MMEFIFYTDEGYTFSPDNTKVENLQVLGIAEGDGREKALENLIVENEWISETKFNIERIIARQLVKY